MDKETARQTVASLEALSPLNASLRARIANIFLDISAPQRVAPNTTLFRAGDVSNVVFSNGAVLRKNGDVLVYYGSSDTRMHVATTTLERFLDYVEHTPEDGLRSAASVAQRVALIDRNRRFLSARSRQS